MKPTPTTHAAASAREWLASTRMPASLRSSTTRSFGHLSITRSSPPHASASTRATPTARERPLSSFDRSVKRHETDTTRLCPRPEIHRRPRRPRPAVWISAAQSSGAAAPARMRSARKVFVESIAKRTCTDSGRKRGTARRIRPASSRSTGRGRATASRSAVSATPRPDSRSRASSSSTPRSPHSRARATRSRGRPSARARTTRAAGSGAAGALIVPRPNTDAVVRRDPEKRCPARSSLRSVRASALPGGVWSMP